MKNITIYSTPSCIYCRIAKSFLKSKNIPFKEIDVFSDLAAREEMVKKSGQLGVPVIDVDGQVMVGFDQTELTKLVSAD